MAPADRRRRLDSLADRQVVEEPALHHALEDHRIKHDRPRRPGCTGYQHAKTIQSASFGPRPATALRTPVDPQQRYPNPLPWVHRNPRALALRAPHRSEDAGMITRWAVQIMLAGALARTLTQDVLTTMFIHKLAIATAAISFWPRERGKAHWHPFRSSWAALAVSLQPRALLADSPTSQSILPNHHLRSQRASTTRTNPAKKRACNSTLSGIERLAINTGRS
jgi:hypothetical protein